jgi:hypothetical protein
MLYERLLKELKSHKEDIEMLILQDQIEDFESYRYYTGKLKGINDAIDICRETFRRSDDA